jgi:peptidoglycan/xylan/chitin deacetylase (PgdA/CDA1 family)
MEYVKTNYNLISGRELVDYCSGGAGVSENSLMITFDDGFKDTIENAFPVLEEMKIPAVVFVASDFINGQYVPWEDECAYLINKVDLGKMALVMPNVVKKDEGENDRDGIIFRICKNLRGASKSEREGVLGKLYECSKLEKTDVQNRILEADKGIMDRDDLMKWVSAALEVGGHTCSHPQLSKIDSAMVEKELRISKSKLEEITKKEVLIFAYPYGLKGYYNRDSIRLVQKEDYKCAVSLKGGINTLKTNKFDLRRMGIAPYVSFEKACDGCLI